MGHITGLASLFLTRLENSSPMHISGNGKIEFEEFVDLMETQIDPKVEERSCLESFRAFDVSNKGYVSSRDVRDTLMEVMAKCPEDDRQKILKLFRLDVDRRVLYEGM